MSPTDVLEEARAQRRAGKESSQSIQLAFRCLKPPLDTLCWARNFERAPATMWQRHVGGAVPASIVVEEDPG
jgi:hypothetical protein